MLDIAANSGVQGGQQCEHLDEFRRTEIVSVAIFMTKACCKKSGWFYNTRDR